MEVILRMAVRDMLPEVVNRAAGIAGRPLSSEERADIQLRKVIDAPAPPTEEDDLFVLDTIDPVRIESVELLSDGTAEVQLEDFDTDQVATMRPLLSNNCSPLAGRLTSIDRTGFPLLFRSCKEDKA